MSGWFPVARGITAHPLMKAQPERLALWLWLLDHAAWKQTTFDVKGKLVAVPSGSVFVAVRRLAEETGVGYQVARTFLRHLQRAGMIRIEPKHGLSLISILDHAKDPPSPGKVNAAPNAALTQSQRTKEEGGFQGRDRGRGCHAVGIGQQRQPDRGNHPAGHEQKKVAQRHVLPAPGQESERGMD